MSTSITLYMDTGLAVQNVNDILVSALGYQPSRESMLGRYTIVDVFAIEEDMSFQKHLSLHFSRRVNFSISKMENAASILEALQTCSYLLEADTGDAYLEIQDRPLLIRRNGKTLLNATEGTQGFWTATYLAQITIPFLKRPFPRMFEVESTSFPEFNS